jgi:hypothetical protein
MSNPSDQSTDADSRPRRACPFCAELILVEARICRYCQRELPSQEVASAPPAANLENSPKAIVGHPVQTSPPAVTAPTAPGRDPAPLIIVGILIAVVLLIIIGSLANRVGKSGSQPGHAAPGENGRPWPGTYSSIDNSWNSEAAKNKQADARTEAPMFDVISKSPTPSNKHISLEVTRA